MNRANSASNFQRPESKYNTITSTTTARAKSNSQLKTLDPRSNPTKNLRTALDEITQRI